MNDTKPHLNAYPDPFASPGFLLWTCLVVLSALFLMTDGCQSPVPAHDQLAGARSEVTR